MTPRGNPRAHYFSARGELLVGLGALWVGTMLLWQSYEGRGRSRPFVFKLLAPGG